MKLVVLMELLHVSLMIMQQPRINWKVDTMTTAMG